jgi:hypothetical protein
MLQEVVMSDLEELLISGQEIDREMVAGVLKPLLRIDSESSAIRPQVGWRHASNDARILAYLLARKAMLALGLPLQREAAGPSEVVAATGIPKGSVHPGLMRLYEHRPQLVDKDASSRYFVPGWAVEAGCEYIGQHTKLRGA